MLLDVNVSIAIMCGSFHSCYILHHKILFLNISSCWNAILLLFIVSFCSMASKLPAKRKKSTPGASSSRQPSFDSSLLRSPAHEERFYANIMNRSVLSEKKLIVQATDFPEVQTKIVKRRWDKTMQYRRRRL